MKKVAKVYVLLVIFLAVWLTAFRLEGADWKEMKGSFPENYYDAESIVRSDKNIVRVWVKQIVIEEVTLDPNTMLEIGNRRKIKKKLMLFEFDCNQRKYRILNISTEYENKQRQGQDYPYGEKWLYLPPDESDNLYVQHYNNICQ